MINTENYCADIRIIRDADTELTEKSIQLKQVLERLCKEATQSEAMQFSTLFSRLVFIAQKYNLPKRTEWELQNFRVMVTEQWKNNIPEQYWIYAIHYHRRSPPVILILPRIILL